MDEFMKIQTILGRAVLTALVGYLGVCGAQSAPAAPVVVPATPAPAAPAPVFSLGTSGISVSGFVDAYASYNANTPTGGANTLYNFNTAANSFALNLAELKFIRPVDKVGDWGFTAIFGYGNAANIVTAADPSGDTSLKNVIQAFGSYKAPIGKGLQIDVGKFVTSNGAEVIETKDNWNYSRGLLFAYAIPYYHVGVRTTYVFNPKITTYAMLVNGWNNVTDNNAGKTVGFGGTYTPNSKWSLTENLTVGPEQTNDNHDYRKLTDTVLSYTPSSTWAFLANYDFGEDRLAGVTQRWQGAAAYVKYAFNTHVALIPRVEWFTDPQGFQTGKPQQVREITMTSEYKVSDNTLTRAEYRHDRSSIGFFPLHSPTRLSKDQDTGTLGVIFMF